MDVSEEFMASIFRVRVSQACDLQAALTRPRPLPPTSCPIHYLLFIPGSSWIGDWVGPRACLDMVAKKIILAGV
jgi:hypothetical protein